MSSAIWYRLIGASVIPVVVISATGLLCLAFYNRLAMIVSRLRLFQRERLQQQELRDQSIGMKDTSNAVRHERLIDLLGQQTQNVMKRAKLIRSTLLLCLMAISSLLVCSIFCGLTVIWDPAIYMAVFTFVAGLLLLLGGVLCAIVEMRMSLEPIELESEIVAMLAP